MTIANSCHSSMFDRPNTPRSRTRGRSAPYFGFSNVDNTLQFGLLSQTWLFASHPWPIGLCGQCTLVITLVLDLPFFLFCVYLLDGFTPIGAAAPVFGVMIR
ncbi:hypothetical protein CVT26_009463 [Gymnopilus dilepis]|uniref:Uncharacterized protein n=1 Tax=Gymnopilus dilepis TaxID=231916 RepID=A0A409YID1_9AGAR|nr:hypothetical protein CVT26_009463 [Gymnopilus dilepis]